ncbi:esterase 1 [Agrocybe pediades]|nr:esterase 1 [Agrocybe pediades]
MLLRFLQVLATFAVFARAAAPQIKLGRTTLTGRHLIGLKVDFFGGIPYAEPPLGNLRLRPPVLKTTLDVDTLDASNFGKGCLQPTTSATEFSEDCLTINVFRPSGISSNAKLPILFWTYGGGFQTGESSLFNGSLIVAQSVARGTPLIYVNYNYRLGPLGFPQGREAAQRGELNLALRDQLAALEWVQANIGTFGGDKEKVTVFGESAGAVMTAVLFMNSPLEKLARAAILESGSPATASEFNSTRRQIDWENFVAAVPSCASLAKTDNTFDCLREKANSTEMLSGVNNAISQAPEEFAFDPTVDGPGGLLPVLPSNILEHGSFAKLPFIAGTNLDEGTIFIPQTTISEADLRAALIFNLTPPLVPEEDLQFTVDRILELYPDDPAVGSPFNTGNETFGMPGFKRAAAIFGDHAFQSQRRVWSQAAARFGVKTFGYYFTQPQPTNPPFFGVSHASELDFVYGVPPTTSDNAVQLSRMMVDYWVSFATSLDPNDGKGTQRPLWPQYTTENQVLLQLNGLNMTVIPDTYRKEQIDFINSDPLVWHHRRSLCFGRRSKD